MKFLFVLFLSLFSLSASAQIEFGVTAGFRSGEIETDIQYATTSGRTGIHAGVLAYLPIHDNWGLRSGFLYTRRPAMIDNTLSGQVDIQYAYFDVPATVLIKFADYAGAFAGPVIAFNQSREVSCSLTNCSAQDVQAVVMPWQLGLNFRFLPSVGAEMFYEYLPGELSASVSNMRTVGASVIFYLE